LNSFKGLFPAFLRISAHPAMQAFFSRVDLAAYREQQQLIAAQLKENPPPRAAAPLPPRSVGRPKLKRSADAMLADAATADALAQQADSKRGKYTRWFNEPLLINDILNAHAKNGGSARATVKFLQKHASDDRFARLSHSTVASWFDKHGQLLSTHQAALEHGRELSHAGGQSPALQAAPDAENAICDILLQLREAGTPVNSHIIRWVMQAVLQDKCPALLQQLKLSQAFISNWVRNHPRLQYRWRARTTAASKLPDDWEAQGVCMAQRIAALMQLYKVRNMLGVRLTVVFLQYSSRASAYSLSDSSISRHQHGPDGSEPSLCIQAHVRNSGQRRCRGRGR
jgi:hypothetical protein